MRDELYHHGILGQKWGIENGPPYPLKASQHNGREKFKASIRENTEKVKKAVGVKPKQDRPNYSVKWKKPSEMTSEELKEAINRMSSEKQYKSLYSELNPKKQSFVAKLWADTKKKGPGAFQKYIGDPLMAQIGKDIVESITGKEAKEEEKEDKKNQKLVDKILDAMEERAKKNNENQDSSSDASSSSASGRRASGIRATRWAEANVSSAMNDSSASAATSSTTDAGYGYLAWILDDDADNR